jgi:hypothetical protein
MRTVVGEWATLTSVRKDRITGVRGQMRDIGFMRANCRRRFEEISRVRFAASARIAPQYPSRQPLGEYALSNCSSLQSAPGVDVATELEGMESRSENWLRWWASQSPVHNDRQSARQDRETLLLSFFCHHFNRFALLQVLTLRTSKRFRRPRFTSCGRPIGF